MSRPATTTPQVPIVKHALWDITVMLLHPIVNVVPALCWKKTTTLVPHVNCQEKKTERLTMMIISAPTVRLASRGITARCAYNVLSIKTNLYLSLVLRNAGIL